MGQVCIKYKCQPLGLNPQLITFLPPVGLVLSFLTMMYGCMGSMIAPGLKPLTSTSYETRSYGAIGPGS